MKERLEKLLAEYGKIALFTYLALSLTAIIGFSIAIAVGFGAETATGFFGVVAAGWLAAKATMPLRILATLALTPLIAALVRRITKRRPGDLPNAADPDSDSNVDAKGDQPNAGK